MVKVEHSALLRYHPTCTNSPFLGHTDLCVFVHRVTEPSGDSVDPEMEIGVGELDC